MRSCLTNRVQYKPILEWKELHNINMNPSTVPDSSTFEILNTGRECEDDDKHQHTASIDDNTCAKLNETRKSNPPDVINTLEMESPSGIEGQEAWRFCQNEARRKKT